MEVVKAARGTQGYGSSRQDAEAPADFHIFTKNTFLLKTPKKRRGLMLQSKLNLPLRYSCL